MTRPILVTAAIIEKNGEYLITQRLDKQHNGGRWEFPGGKVEFGEDPRVCLEREIDEELGIQVKAGTLFEYSSHVYDEKKHIILLGIHCTYVAGEIMKHDIKDFAWVAPEQMTEYDITEADVPFVEKLKK